MTHYSLTEEQMGMFDPTPPDPEGEVDAENALLEALQSTPADPSDTRMKHAILSGLLVPELLPSRMEREQAEREGREDDQRRQQEQQMPERYEDESEEDYQLRLQQEDDERRQQDERR